MNGDMAEAHGLHDLLHLRACVLLCCVQILFCQTALFHLSVRAQVEGFVVFTAPFATFVECACACLVNEIIV